jgi:hypothetical protein
MGAAILDPNIEYLFGDVTSGSNIDIRLKLYFKRDICGFTPLYYTYSPKLDSYQARNNPQLMFTKNDI